MTEDKKAEAKAQAMRDFATIASMGANEAVSKMIEGGYDEAIARDQLTRALLDMAAGTACKTRRQLLGGEPDPAKWSAAATAAFDRAVERTARLAKVEDIG